MKSKTFVRNLLAKADIQINGNRPWDISVSDERLYNRVVSKGSLGLGEAYMDGWWDSQKLDEFFFRSIRSGLHRKIEYNLISLQVLITSKIFNLQTRRGSKQIAEQHYDLGNDLYMSFLDPYNQYTCGYFKDTDDLNIAQENKMELICKKLELKPGDRVLDIGCGWGGLAKYIAEHYKCRVTGISISDEQIEFARDYTKGLDVEILKLDYRDLTGTFDKIVSVGMFEHVGPKNYRTILKIVERCLVQDGLFLLHCIGDTESNTIPDAWMTKYIFPNSKTPTAKQITEAAEGLFVLEDLHNFSAYYDPTLMAWYKNFEKNWPRLKNIYGDRFFRMFKYYLLLCAGSFRARAPQLFQFVFSKKGILGGYTSIR